jgi:hypothetical protein
MSPLCPAEATGLDGKSSLQFPRQRGPDETVEKRMGLVLFRNAAAFLRNDLKA